MITRFIKISFNIARQYECSLSENSIYTMKEKWIETKKKKKDTE